ncbi:MAG: dTDP-4-dehydrorhamnose reductase [Thermoplasmata archaeon]|jgi:dTDP-4-dehydrorhamnose reductase|nr:dTDP-4-dehydrorhamnose reductase [Thermoplasmata archaeon]
MAPSSERIVVLGATGQLGTDVVQAARGRGLTVVGLATAGADVTRPESLAAAFAAHKPTLVVNCAAFHQVDKCEDDPAQAFAVNAVGALHAARAAKAAGARTVYVSTDYVFDGRKPVGSAYAPEDAPGPLNVYGASKLAGEQLTRQADPAALVVRVASLFGKAGSRGKGGNFVENILRKAKAGEPVSVVADQWMSPTWTVDAAAQILDAALAGRTGTMHATSGGSCSWWAFAQEAVRAAGLEVVVKQGSVKDWPSKAQRPANSALAGGDDQGWVRAVKAYVRSG